MQRVQKELDALTLTYMSSWKMSNRCFPPDDWEPMGMHKEHYIHWLNRKYNKRY